MSCYKSLSAACNGLLEDVESTRPTGWAGLDLLAHTHWTAYGGDQRLTFHLAKIKGVQQQRHELFDLANTS